MNKIGNLKSWVMNSIIQERNSFDLYFISGILSNVSL